MSMIKSKVAKVAVIFMAVAMTIVPLNAFAETQIKRPTFQGQTVLCTLECTFHPIDDDEGLAMTAWYGKKDILLRRFYGNVKLCLVTIKNLV